MELRLEGKAVSVTTGGRDLDVDQPLIVFVHGAGMDRTAWQLVTRHFSHHGFSVMAVDLPGHGRSAGPPLATIPDLATWVERLIAAAGWQTAHLVGHSMGSLIAIELAATSSTVVTSLTLIGTAAEMPVHPDLLAAAGADDHLAVDLVNSWSLGRPAHLGGHRTPGLWMLGSGARLLERAKPGVLATDLAACDSYKDAVERAEAIVAPTLLLIGERDIMTRPQAADPLRSALKDVTTAFAPATGHLPMIEHPDFVIDSIADFLENRA